jgi:isochorismate synthase
MNKPSAQELIADAQAMSFFYASPAGSLRGDGAFEFTTDVSEGALLLARASQVCAEPLLVGALPFWGGAAARLMVLRGFARGGPASMAEPSHRRLGQGASFSAASPDDEGFRRNVRQALALFRETSLRKVVLSRAVDWATPVPLEVKDVVSDLLSRNRLARVFAVASLDTERSSTLVGASPEVLVEKRGQEIRSNPLAGSAPRHGDLVEDLERGQALLRSAKDQREHAMAVASVEEVLRPLCVSLDVPRAPSLIATPRMWHLSTAIRGKLKQPSPDVLTIARNLHPTAAICGSPTAEARRAIGDLEGREFDRELFTGMVGWMNPAGDGEWAVTIRCAELRRTTVRVYAGAGIVEGSDPDRELAEVSGKLCTMCDALGIALPGSDGP